MPLNSQNAQLLRELEARQCPDEYIARVDLKGKASALFKCEPTKEERLRIAAVVTKFSVAHTQQKASSSTSSFSSSNPQSPLFQAQSDEFLKLLFQLLVPKPALQTKIVAEQIKQNIWELIQNEKAGGLAYAHFCNDGLVALRKLQHFQHNFCKANDGILALLVKLSPPYVNENSLGNYKGALAELLEILVSSTKKDRIIKVPTSNRTVAPELDQSEKALGEQDIDRIETIGICKYYIEVKADVETAIAKHGKTFPRIQLLQILNVIATRDRRDLHRHSGIKYQRFPAVSVLNPLGWMKFFQLDTAKIYADLGFYLFIGGERFSPQQLKLIYDHVQKAQRGREKEFHHANYSIFPNPGMVARGLARGMLPALKLDSLPEPGNTSSHRHDTIHDNTWNPQHDPILIRTNQKKPGLFGAIGDHLRK